MSGRRPPLQCEPTRVCEGYVVEVAPTSLEEMEKSPIKMFDGTLLGELYQCAVAVDGVKKLNPKDKLQGMTPQQAQQACCLYKKAVWNFLKSHDLTRCELLARVAEQKCPLDMAGIISTMDYLDTLLDEFLKDCVCLALLPPCPADPGDPRVILACVRVQGQGDECRIVDICHWHGRRFVWTWPNAFYWLSVGALFKQIFENACCNKDIPEPPPPPPLNADPAVTDVSGTRTPVRNVINWKIKVVNNGPDAAQKVVLKATVTADDPNVKVTPNEKTFSIETLLDGQSQEFSFDVAFTGESEGGFEMTLVATVSSDTEDRDLTNNSRNGTFDVVVIE